jgi:hypothetical protein
MLKSLETKHNDRDITLQCTHRKKFPPPQMYGLTAEDVDKMWKQGAIDQTLHQRLVIWRDMCGLFQMGPKCMGCKQALLEKPRPGRPNVIETENWLGAKRRIELEDQKAARTLPEDREVPEAPESEPNPPRAKPRIQSGNTNLGLVGAKVQQDFEARNDEEAAAMAELQAKMAAETEEPEAKQPMMRTGSPVPVTVVSEDPPEEETAAVPEPVEEEHTTPPETLEDTTITDETIEPPSEEEGLDDDVIAALADD